MITGFNTDISYRGIVYHVQTGDRGMNNPRVETKIYRRGAILDTRQISYADIISSDCVEEVVSELIRELHEETIAAIRAGHYADEQTELLEARQRARKALEETILQYLSQRRRLDEDD